jgi:hypothetical protein
MHLAFLASAVHGRARENTKLWCQEVTPTQSAPLIIGSSKKSQMVSSIGHAATAVRHGTRIERRRRTLSGDDLDEKMI